MINTNDIYCVLSALNKKLHGWLSGPQFGSLTLIDLSHFNFEKSGKPREGQTPTNVFYSNAKFHTEWKPILRTCGNFRGLQEWLGCLHFRGIAFHLNLFPISLIPLWVSGLIVMALSKFLSLMELDRPIYLFWTKHLFAYLFKAMLRLILTLSQFIGSHPF